MKELVLITVLLTALSVIAKPTYASQATAHEIAPDCTNSIGTNAAKPIMLECKITPTDNGYVDNLLPTKSFGGSAVLIVQNIPSVPVAKNYAFLKFAMVGNLPSGLLQSGARPENASLQMYVRLMNFFYNATVEIHNASSENWTENTLTWNTMPQIDSTNYVSLNIMQNGTWARWNITPLVQPSSNYSTQIAFAAISSETSWKNLIWFDSDEYPFANRTTSPILELTFLEPYLTIETPFPDIPISVGGSTFLTGADGRITLLVPWGIYAVTVPDTIFIANGTRAQFIDWSDRTNDSSRILLVGNNVTVSAYYGIQHELSVSSPYGNVIGAGWYFQNTEAAVSVKPMAVAVRGVEGWFGAQYVFDAWVGACTGTTPQCNVLVNHPESVEAVWRVDWSRTEIGASIIAILLAFLTLLKKKRRRLTKTHKMGASRSHRFRYQHSVGCWQAGRNGHRV